MINNPLPYQVEKDDDEIYLTNQFDEHCSDVARSIAKQFNLLPSFYDEFIEYFKDLCRESDDGYSLVNDKSLIDDWWEKNSDMYDDPSPYEDYEPTDGEMLSSFGTKWHDRL